MSTLPPTNSPPWNKDSIEKAFDNRDSSELVAYMKKIVIYLDGMWSDISIAVNGNARAYATAVIDDISSATSAWCVSPVAGEVVKIRSVIDGTTSGTDATLTPKIGGTPITGGAITIASGSGAGDTDSSTPTDENRVAEGSAIEIACDGLTTGAVTATIVFEVAQ